MNKKIVITGSVLGLLAVILGAFGAHGLEKVVDSNSIASYNTGVRYQMYHALLLLFLGQSTLLLEANKRIIFYLLLIGVILFSGSIYILVVDALLGIDAAAIGFITPLGGLLLIAAWAYMVKGVYTNHKTTVS